MSSTLTLLRDLVAINSVNPSLVAGAPGEAEAAACVEAFLRAASIDTRLVEVAPGRPNVIGVVEGARPGRTVLLCAHLDTVGVDGMEAPFTPVERDGRLYGRGAQDMKAGLAACAGVAASLAQHGLESGRVVVAGVIDEEHASLGAEALVRDWTADTAVVTEPTDLAVTIAHKGFAWLDIETRGRAAHGSRPEEGRDAIMRMGRVLGVLERFDQELRARPSHPLLGSGSLHASRIDGGREISVYPAHCRLQIERRTVPGEDGERALREVEQMLVVLKEADREFEGHARLVMSRPPYEIDERAEAPQLLLDVCRQQGIETTVAGMSYWTDAAILAGAGIPTVIFGPAGAGLHGPVEWVDLTSVERCAGAIEALVHRLTLGPVTPASTL
jgi:acetylornithine deacetylase